MLRSFDLVQVTSVLTMKYTVQMKYSTVQMLTLIRLTFVFCLEILEKSKDFMNSITVSWVRTISEMYPKLSGSVCLYQNSYSYLCSNSPGFMPTVWAKLETPVALVSSLSFPLGMEECV
jgi:predicted small secreted protein